MKRSRLSHADKLPSYSSVLLNHIYIYFIIYKFYQNETYVSVSPHSLRSQTMCSMSSMSGRDRRLQDFKGEWKTRALRSLFLKQVDITNEQLHACVRLYMRAPRFFCWSPTSLIQNKKLLDLSWYLT